jgi:hypothetical protein
MITSATMGGLNPYNAWNGGYIKGCVIEGIIPPFSQGKPGVPSIGTCKTHASEVIFNTLVDPLSLMISLGVVS